MMQKWLKRIFILLGSVVLGVAVLVGYVIFDYWYANSYKSHIQTLKIPKEKIQFVLMTDLSGFGDQAWYVYKIPIGMKNTNQMETGRDREGVIFFNYSEGGDHCDNAKIETVNKKYLVFSRGGLYHSLYDIENNVVLINDESPWHSFQESDKFKKETKAPFKKTGTAMDAWVRKNLHNRISKVINETT